MALTLVIGNKNYSTWSLRAWLALKMAGVEFSEQLVSLRQPGVTERILRYSPNARVPCLIDSAPPADRGEVRIWDSLAICEYVNEAYADAPLWPQGLVARARARAVSAEMHAGFAPLRQHLSMDIRAERHADGQRAQQRTDVTADIERIRQIWRECLQQYGGPFLFGGFSIADAMFAPVVCRFVTYGVALEAPLSEYGERVLGLAPMQEWVAAARAETEVVDY